MDGPPTTPAATRAAVPYPRQPAAGPPRDPAQGGAGGLADRVDAIGRFIRATEPYLPASRLDDARDLADRATQRLTLPLTLTVVALAGATGGGKSSLFNALAGADLSPVGARRPTTGEVHAAVFAPMEKAVDLLDWLKVEPARRFGRPAPAAGQPSGPSRPAGPAGLSDLILLDLPDFDSVERGHAAEVDRLLRLVDVVVWVVDPQKYADQLLHQHQLARYGRHRDITLVVLNQADRLSGPDADRLLADLRGLLAADGLDAVSAVATSAVAATPGVAPLRDWLEQVVAGRRAPLQRLSADLDAVVVDLADVVAAPAVGDRTDPAVAGELASGMVQVAAVPAVIDTLMSGYRSRAAAAMRAPAVRLLRRLRGAPEHPAEAAEGGGPPAPAPTLAPGAAGRSAADLVVRRAAARAADGLPDPWPAAAATAGQANLDALLDGVARAVRDAQLDLDRPPWWWRVITLGQWLATAASATGLAWYAAGLLVSAAGLPLATPSVRGLSWPAVLVLAGLAGSVALSVAGRQLAGWHARRLGARAATRLRMAITEVGRWHVLAPLRTVLRAYAAAREALAAAAGR